MIENKLNKILPELIEIRRDLHKNYAELSGYETETTLKIKSIIAGNKNNIFEFSDAGLVEIIEGKNPKLNVLIRADIDALPIIEINDIDYKSTKKGTSHKCGHDGHTTILIGLSKLLNEFPLDNLNIYLLWQSSEENGKGAQKAFNEFFLEKNIDYAFALHNLPSYPEKQIILKEGSFTPEVKSIIIKLKGKTSHAAEPDKGLNPANMISELVQYFDTLNNLDSTNSKFYIATPIHINLGSKDYGISAGEGELHYTLRANNHLHFQNNTEKITDKIEQLAKKYKMRFEISWTEEFSANINDKEAFTLLKDVATSNDLEFKIINYPMKWGEDFGIFTQKYKGAMFGIGIGEDKPALHNPDYDFNDNIIATGIKMFFGILEQLNKSK